MALFGPTSPLNNIGNRFMPFAMPQVGIPALLLRRLADVMKLKRGAANVNPNVTVAQGAAPGTPIAPGSPFHYGNQQVDAGTPTVLPTPGPKTVNTGKMKPARRNKYFRF